jgi:hypothetical protein
MKPTLAMMRGTVGAGPLAIREATKVEEAVRTGAPDEADNYSDPFPDMTPIVSCVRKRARTVLVLCQTSLFDMSSVLQEHERLMFRGGVKEFVRS